MGRVSYHHHHIALVARISLTLSRHSSLSFIALGRSSGQHPVSSHSCWMYVRAGRPAFARPCVGVAHIYMHTYTHIYIYSFSLTLSLSHTHTYTHTHTHAHIYIIYNLGFSFFFIFYELKYILGVQSIVHKKLQNVSLLLNSNSMRWSFRCIG